MYAIIFFVYFVFWIYMPKVMNHKSQSVYRLECQLGSGRQGFGSLLRQGGLLGGLGPVLYPNLPHRVVVSFKWSGELCKPLWSQLDRKAMYR